MSLNVSFFNLIAKKRTQIGILRHGFNAAIPKEISVTIDDMYIRKFSSYSLRCAICAAIIGEVGDNLEFFR